MLDWLFKFAPFAELQLNGFIYCSFNLFPLIPWVCNLDSTIIMTTTFSKKFEKSNWFRDDYFWVISLVNIFRVGNFPESQIQLYFRVATWLFCTFSETS